MLIFIGEPEETLTTERSLCYNADRKWVNTQKKGEMIYENL